MIDGFAEPYLYAGGVCCFVAADIVEAWLSRGLRGPWRIAEDRRDYRPAASP